MFDVLWSWEFWVAVVIVFVLVFWLSSKVDTTQVSRETARHPKSSRDATLKYETITEKTVACPPLPILSEAPSEHEDISIDLTPSIPEEVLGNGKPPQYVRNVSSRSKGEQECKEALERIYSPYKFSTVRPKWLKGPKGYPLELDLFNEELGIAVEYNGEQHYKYVPKFHRNGVSDLAYQSKCDNLKVDLCDQHGVYLITVPYNIPVEKIENYIRYYSPEMVLRRQQASSGRKY